jgi:hypothetical protein
LSGALASAPLKIAAARQAFERPTISFASRAFRQSVAKKDFWHRSELKSSAKTLDVNPDRIQSLLINRASRKMRQQFFGSHAEMHEADNNVWTDATMKFGTYSFLAFALAVILAECGHMVYHLTTIFH